MNHTDRIRKAIAREERKRELRPAKPAKARKPRPHKRIRWDRPLPHEVRA